MKNDHWEAIQKVKQLTDEGVSVEEQSSRLKHSAHWIRISQRLLRELDQRHLDLMRQGKLSRIGAMYLLEFTPERRDAVVESAGLMT